MAARGVSPGRIPSRLARVRSLAAAVRSGGARLGGARCGQLAHAAQTGAARHGGAMMAAIAVALAFQFPLSGLWHG